jgi:hypothetical protein
MKVILVIWCFCFSFSSVAQIEGGSLTYKDLKDLAGNWAGTMVYTAERSQVTYQSKLEIVDMKDSLMFNCILTGPDGKQVIEKYAMYIYDNGNKLRFDSNEFEIVAIRRRGVRLTVIIEREGVDNYRSADFQQTIIIGPANLNIERKIRYTDMVDYFIRSRTSLTKK